MNIWLALASLSFLSLACAHSWLGERKVLRPLLAQEWKIGLPRPFANPLLRWAWHLTSFVWLAAAGILVAAATGRAVPAFVIDLLGAAALVSGVAMLVGLRGMHAAWAVLMIGALGCFIGAHGWPGGDAARTLAGVAASLTLLFLGALHVYWVAGGRWGLAVAVPTRADGTPTMRPSALATIAVAGALFTTAGIIASAAGLLPSPSFLWSGWARHLGLAAAAVFGLRMIGDFRFAGLFKREWRTEFARWDSQLFSPLCGALCLACAIAAF
jgi:Protein of unknown function (DUF3995)